jgi:hypothetical protein
LIEVPTQVATWYEFAYYSSHNADNNFQLENTAVKLRCDPFIFTIGNKKLDNRAVFKELYYAIK